PFRGHVLFSNGIIMKECLRMVTVKDETKNVTIYTYMHEIENETNNLLLADNSSKEEEKLVLASLEDENLTEPPKLVINPNQYISSLNTYALLGQLHKQDIGTVS